jgi:LuxR family transcriptional regulator, maltose regulon positive regulatory protein
MEGCPLREGCASPRLDEISLAPARSNGTTIDPQAARPAKDAGITMIAGQPTVEVHVPGRPAFGVPFAILESKLTPQVRRDGMVARAALLHRLEASGPTPVVAVIAPPGYGKTTLLAQWAERDPRPFAWLSLDQYDNDPAVLLAYIAAALHRVEPLDPGIFGVLTSRGTLAWQAVLPRLGSALAAGVHPLVLVLDDVHVLQRRECLDALMVLVEHLPEGSQLAIASRGEPPLPVARLRAQGRVAEIGAAHLAMDRREAGSLLRAAKVEIADADATQLLRRTEGWPAALYLAALSLRTGASQHGTGPALVVADRFLADYLHAVLLSRLSDGDVQFLTRTALLDRVSGPLCDAILQRTGSAELLDWLERSNLLVIPLDRQRRWYRYHHLFRELLRADLERHEPKLVRDLNLRAAEWYESNDLPETAIEHAMQAGDADRAARLVERLALPLYHGGRTVTLQRWFEWFEKNGQLERYPTVAVVGACVHALVGEPVAAERWAEAAERGSFEETPDRTNSNKGWLPLLRTVRCRNGVEQMRKDAQTALALLPASSVWRPTAMLLLGISYLLADDPGLADGVFRDAFEMADDAGATNIASLALAERSILAIGRQEWAEAELLVERARSLMHDAHQDDHVTSVLLLAMAGRVAIHRGDARQAHEDLARAQRLRSRATYALSFLAVQVRLELVRAYIALTDVGGARIVLREVDDLLRRRPDLGNLSWQGDKLRIQLETIRAEASSLTAAELRLLPLLSTHHSFREIGDQLHVSPHTVKSQAMSIYRKFGVSSRSQAIRHAQELGLLAA